MKHIFIVLLAMTFGVHAESKSDKQSLSEANKRMFFDMAVDYEKAPAVIKDKNGCLWVLGLSSTVSGGLALVRMIDKDGSPVCESIKQQ